MNSANKNSMFQIQITISSNSMEKQGKDDTFATEIPDEVRDLIFNLYLSIKACETATLRTLYENTIPELSKKHFSSSTWPAPEAVAHIVKNDSMFLLLYKEFYFRHVFANLRPTIQNRVGAWHNYCNLFETIAEETTSALVVLPDQWMWDIVDDFVYQMQSFTLFRNKKNFSGEDVEPHLQNTDVWNIERTLKCLTNLVKGSSLVRELCVKNKIKWDFYIKEEFAKSHFHKMLGYYALIELCRVHALLGDYELALRTVAPISLKKGGLFSEVQAVHFTLFYHVGFCYLMLRRYSDAVDIFSSILSYSSVLKNVAMHSYQQEAISKKIGQMYSLLAISIALNPTELSAEIIYSLLEKHREDLKKLKGEIDFGLLEDMFQRSCPKFVSPFVGAAGTGQKSADPYKVQSKVFLNEIKQQAHLSTLRSSIRLFQHIELDKLASLMSVTKEELINRLLCFKHKLVTRKWEMGPLHSGEQVYMTDIDFYIDKNIVYIVGPDRKELVVRQLLDAVEHFMNRGLSLSN